LNIGLDAIAFLDDSEVERAQIELDLPEVHVIDPGPDAFQMARRVQEFPLFARLTVSSEDKDRVQLYRTQQERAVLAGGCETIVDFYHSLQQEVSVARLSAQTLARAAQLTQKTNQFNLTTHRYSEQVLSDRSAADGWETFVVSVKDRFGDNGIVGVVVVRTQGESCEIDTFLMSCRVIGRSVETAMLSAVVANARARGARVLTGTFIPTKKNEPAKRFFDSHGFAPASSDDGTAEHWVLDLETKTVECPEWIKLAIPEGAYEHAASR
jgi:FkbH-like protein